MGYWGDRCYVRGWTWLGLLNTVLGALLNRVVVRETDDKTGKTVSWSWCLATDFPAGRFGTYRPLRRWSR